MLPLRLLIGDDGTSDKATKLNTKRSSRPYRLRMVPWKFGRMPHLAVLLFASNVRGLVTVKNQARALNSRNSNQNQGISFVTEAAHLKGSPNSAPRQPRFDTDSFRIKVDNCCTRSITPHMTDFVGPVTEIHNAAIRGFNGGTSKIKHTGTVRWYVDDDSGVRRELLIPNTYHVPEAPTRLLSPQHWAQQMKDNVPEPRGTWCATYDTEIVLQWNQRKHTRTIKLDPEAQNVGTMWSSAGYEKFVAYSALNEPHELCYDTHNVVSDDDMSDHGEESEPEETDDMHEKADAPPPTMREHGLTTDFNLDGPDTGPNMIDDTLEDHGIETSALMLRWHNRLAHVSMKRIQLMAKRGQLPAKLAKCRVPMCPSCEYGKASRRKWRSKTPTNADKPRTIAAPGICVSVDQLESSTVGFIGQLKGKLTTARYRAATIFVDHFSDMSFVHLQQSTSASETLLAKAAFESYARTCGVNVLHYHADNGRFAENAWREDCRVKNQQLTFCGVSAHHQNGRAEKKIRDTQDLARTSMLHSIRRWPTAITANLWPYAMRHANDVLNRTPRVKTGQSPEEMFTGAKVLPNVRHDHPFGCPAFALDGDLQNGKKIGKWESRARLGIYLGPSPQHARTVGLLLSLKTGLVSPQFHIKFDDLFETVRTGEKGTLPASQWQSLARLTATNAEGAEKASNPEGAKSGVRFRDQVGVPTDEAPNIPPTEHAEQAPVPEAPPPPVPPAPVRAPMPNRHVPQMTRSGRITRPPAHFEDYVRIDTVFSGEIFAMSGDLQSEYQNPVAYASSSDPDVMHLHEALKEPDRAQFVAAMEKEIRAHTLNGNWVIMLRTDVPVGHQVLPAVWAMRRKRRIDTNVIYKWKARLNIHGGKQTKGVNYWETYAPVATWPSIRLIVNMAARLGWTIRQLDFVLAFPQAPVETDLYMDIPRGFLVDGDKKRYVLKLVNNLYGQKQAGRVWYKFLSKGLTKLGFKQSEHDPCVFWRKSTILVIYTDDTVVTGPDDDDIERAINDISSAFTITTEPMISDFLGVKITRINDTNSYTMTQPHLIKSILEDLGLQPNSVTKPTPARSSVILQRHDSSQAHDHEAWHYRSVIGKLNYLEKCTRPDIAYAVHQAARFSENPKVEHSAAVKHIGRYLLATADKGLVCNPNGDSFQCYADADFAGNWNQSCAAEDPSTARSRSGYLIMHNKCPIVWASRLQTEIALSSTESEYISLSQALREVIPMMRMANELASSKFPLGTDVPIVHCKAFEDNSGALEMARTPKMRPRTKHINLKYHHFREAVEDGTVSIHAINTADQLSDIFTKPLPEPAFTRFRKEIMGW